MPPNLDCDVIGLSAGGEGIARHDGKVVFIPGALPGERVSVEIVRSGATSDRARLLAVLAPAGRRETPCAHDYDGGCGGCTLLHATREAQARAKTRLVQDAVARIAGLDPALVRDALTPGPDLGYRNHMRFGVSRNGRLTFVTRDTDHPARDRDSIEIDFCAVMHSSLEPLRATLDGHVFGVEAVELRAGVNTGDRLAILHGVDRLTQGIDATRFPGALALSYRDAILPVRELPVVHESVAGRRFRISARSFFQVNTAGAECLVDLVLGFVRAAAPRRVLDLYAGVGLFALGAVPADVDVLAAELDPASVADFRNNAADRPRAKLRAATVDNFLADFRSGRDRFDLAIADPPRAGLGPSVIARLGPLAIPHLVFVSCDPGSLARDLRALTPFGYAVREIIPIDQFPGTPHVETVALLTYER